MIGKVYEIRHNENGTWSCSVMWHCIGEYNTYNEAVSATLNSVSRLLLDVLECNRLNDIDSSNMNSQR